jgi:hypothetical protein
VKKNVGNCFLAGLRQQELNVMSCSWQKKKWQH